MGVPAAAGLTVAGVGVFLLACGRRRLCHFGAQAAGLATLLLALLGIIGHLYGVKPLYMVTRLTAVAHVTGLSLLVLGVGLLCARPGRGPMAALTADDAGGRLVRILLLPALMVPLVVGYLRLLGERVGLFDAEMGTALVMLLFIVVLSSTVWLVGRSVSGHEAQERAIRRALRDREAELRLIMDATPALISYIGRDYRYRRVNRGYEKWFGHSVDQVMGRHVREVLGEAAWQNVRPLMERALAGETVTYEQELPYEGGGPRWVQVTYTPDRDETGDVRGFVVHVVDVGRLKRAEEAARHGQQRLRGIFDNAGVGIVEVDTNDRFIAVNDRVCRILGYGKDGLIGKTVHEITAPQDRTMSDMLNAELHSGVRDQIDYEKRYLKADGTPLWVHVTVSPVRDEQGRWVRSIITVEDISARKAAEETLKKTTAELERSNEDLQQFAYIASHDLQEPLRMVTMFLGLLRQKYGPSLDDKAAELIAYAVDGAERMSQLIRDLLQYSRVQSAPAEMTDVDMNAAFDRAASNCQISIARAGAIVRREPLPVVRGNETQLVQLLQNLIANAVKFRRGDVQAEVHVSARREDRQWVFAVRDNGIGIAREQAERVFLIFQRLHTREQYPGTGVGLAICRKIAERHGGRIWVESTPGEGSTFYFVIPDR